ncbi:hypothetical protein B0H21DRAFT_797293 [Amylocystis lapponica]|nr:hypothetical protein B0H21DRAFT_797293 [Amylocystis lapponica]
MLVLMLGMHLLFRVVLLSLSASSARAFSWASPRPSMNARVPPSNGPPQVDYLGPDEIAMVIRDVEGLESYTRRPDCFRRAAGLIRTRCGELDIDEDERVRAAISMTLCELATAKHYSTPLECAAFLPDSDPPNGLAAEPLSSCVECFRFCLCDGLLGVPPRSPRWNDIDTARDIYKNATVEKLALLRFLTDREKKLQGSQQESERLVQDMWSTLVDLRSSATVIESVSDMLESKMHRGLEQALDALQNAADAAYMRSEEQKLQTLFKIDSAIESVIERHAKSLDALLPPLENSLLSQLDSVFSLALNQHRGVLDAVDTTHAHLALIGSDFTAMHQTIAHLASTASEATAHLDAHISAADRAHARQLEASASADLLGDALANLADTVHMEMTRINGTAAAVRAGLLAGAHGPGEWATWARAGAGWLLEFVLRVDPACAEWVFCLPVVRALGVCVRVVAWVVQASMSSVMSVVFFVLSTKRWFAGTREAACAPDGLRACSFSRRRDCEPTCPSVDLDVLPLVTPSGDTGRRRPRTSRIPDRLCKPDSLL